MRCDARLSTWAEVDHELTYQWDTLGRLAEVKSLAGTFAYQYDAKSPALLTRMVAPLHRVDTRYDNRRNLVVSQSNQLQEGEALVSRYDYHNDTLGRRTTLAQRGEAFQQLGSTPAQAIEVAYNERSEVTGATYREWTKGAEAVRAEVTVPRDPDPAAELLASYGFDYDALGNRVQSVVTRGEEKTATTYTANALNQYTAIEDDNENEDEDDRTAAKPQHDPDGNLLDDGEFAYTWNGENRLIAVEAVDGSSRTTYAYDYQGRRIRKAVQRKDDSGAWQTVREHRFAWDGWSLLAEWTREAEGSEVTQYTWGRDLSGSLQGAGRPARGQAPICHLDVLRFRVHFFS